jgi:tetratricopeptide (TPR) repeat protein
VSYPRARRKNQAPGRRGVDGWNPFQNLSRVAANGAPRRARSASPVRRIWREHPVGLFAVRTRQRVLKPVLATEQHMGIAVFAFCVASIFSLQAQPGGLGRIAFPTSGPAEARAHFERGVLFLHSFEYRQAREQFLTAQKMAPAFAMAYWGEAMTYNEPVWFAQDRDAGRSALKRLPVKAPTERERAYLHAVEVLYGEGTKEERDFAYSAAMRRLQENYPDDQEAAAFYALSLIGTCHRGRDFRTYMQAAAVAEAVLEKNAEHPGALHYAIHAYDDPVHAPLGLRAARAYARVAPAAAHAQHMPSHIFLAMGMWDDAARSNEAAWNASSNRQPIESGGYHALWWLQYAYLQQGRFAEARRVLERIEAMASAQPPLLLRFHLVQMRILYSVETGEAHKAGADISGLDVATRAAHFFAAGSDALNRGRREDAEHSLSALRALKPPAAAAAVPHGHDYPGDVRAAGIMENQLAALLLMADGKTQDAIELVKQAAAAEDRTPYEFGPPVPPKPAHEQLGEILLSLGRPDLARVQFELALLRTPKRALSLLGLARSLVQSGKTREALETYTELKRIWSRADPEILKAVEESMRRLGGV